MKLRYIQILTYIRDLLDAHIYWLKQDSIVIQPLASGALPRKGVIFIYRDGTKEKKTLFVHSIKDDILWRGKYFHTKSLAEDTIKYREVNGR